MKKRVLLSVLFVISLQLFSITVDGYAFLENQTNHTDIEIIFEGTMIDTTYTDSTGYYNIEISGGYYLINYSKQGYLGYATFEELFYDTTLAPITLIAHPTLVIVPIDFATIQEAINYTIAGDTVLVQSGVYEENLNVNKQIHIISYYCITQDTSYISQTIIDGGENGTIVSYDCISSTELNGFTLMNGSSQEYGGGIYCRYANPELSNLIITENYAESGGGGIYCFHSSPTIVNTHITNNSSIIGAGIYCEEGSSPNLNNVIISSNTGDCGIGFCCKNPSSPYLENVSIINNTSENYCIGGGMYLGYSTTPSLVNVNIKNNSATTGAGIFSCFNAVPFLSSVSIINNEAISGGAGIFCGNDGSVQFDPQNRCNIYSNYISENRGYGADILLASGESLEVFVDTFTVLMPTEYYASPLGNISFDILHAIQDSLTNQDVYVSINGNNQNSGLSPDEAYKTIRYAMSKIYSDSLNHNTIFVLPGTYGPSTNGEVFPINCSSNITIEGTSSSEVVLDAENENSVVKCNYSKNTKLKNLTIKNGIYPNLFYSQGGGISCSYSTLTLENIKISDNYADDHGGAIYCAYSDLILNNVEISNNNYNEDVFYTTCSTIDFFNVTITNNLFTNNLIYNVSHSNLNFVNCILWNDSNYQLSCHSNGLDNVISFSYSDIKDGINGISYNNTITTLNWLEGNIDEVPIFIETGEFPFSLQDISPCVNAGIADTSGLNLPQLDLAGNTRIYGDRIDMGAYENQNVIVKADDNTISSNPKIANYPNPFNPSTTIKFSIQEESEIDFSIYNIKGQKIRSLLSDQIEAGEHSIVWNGDDKNNNPVSSGIYYYKLDVNGKTKAVRKCLLLK